MNLLKMSSLATSVKKLQNFNCDRLRPETREFIQNFYFQLVSQPLIFTAAGFYVINFTFYASIITGVTSYQIILVQFYTS